MPVSRWTPLPFARMAGHTIVAASRADLVAALLADHELVAQRREPVGPRLVFDINGQGLSLHARDPEYRRAMAAADIVHADGGFLVTLSRWCADRPIPERSATTDLIDDIAAAAAANGLSFYLLGGPETVNARAALRLVQRYPGLRIAGRRHGYFADSELDAVVADIRAAAPDVLWVGLGKPREQAIAIELARQVDATWLVTCGGCFNFVAGDYRRAPRWMQAANLEWLHRLACDPRRLFIRYLVTNPHALWLTLNGQKRAR